jgi:hypothetical protein
MKTITKNEFVALLNEAGVTEAQKRMLHALFEKKHPEAHQSFLEHLSVPPAEIREIREFSRKA